MGNFLRKLIKLTTGVEPARQSTRTRSSFLRNKLTERDLIRMESQIGATLFGPIPAGHRREFFCLDKQTWIWHEEWVDQYGHKQQLTTRYELHPNGILKVQDGQPYTMVEGQELENLVGAMRMYTEQIADQLYHVDPVTAQPVGAF